MTRRPWPGSVGRARPPRRSRLRRAVGPGPGSMTSARRAVRRRQVASAPCRSSASRRWTGRSLAMGGARIGDTPDRAADSRSHAFRFLRNCAIRSQPRIWGETRQTDQLRSQPSDMATYTTTTSRTTSTSVCSRALSQPRASRGGVARSRSRVAERSHHRYLRSEKNVASRKLRPPRVAVSLGAGP